MKTLSFDPANHLYALDGEVIPSVTEITRAVVGKDLSRIPPAVLEAASARGRAIHADVETNTYATPEGKWIMGELVGTEYRREAQAWGELAGITFAGTGDLVGEKDLGDIKTEGEQDLLYWTVQLNLYRHLFATPERLFVLWVPKSGNYKRVPIKVFSQEQLELVMTAWKTGWKLPESFLDGDKPEAPSLDLVIYTHNVGELTTNAKAILETVRTQLAHYKAENYSEDNIAAAKRDKAELNAAAKKLNDRRLELEREFMKPFVEFKDTIATTCDEIKKASGLIDTVVKEVEEREKAEKRKLLEEAWAALDCTLFPLARIWNPAWLNKTSKAKDTIAEMGRWIEKAKADLAVLDRIGEPDAKAYYLDTLNLDGALAEADRIKANRERLARAEADRKTREEAERARMADIASEAPAPAVDTSEPELAQPLPSAPPTEETTEASTQAPEILERTIRVRCSRETMLALGDWLVEHDVEFEKL